MLSKGVDINALLKRQITALGEACSRGFQEVVDLQVKAGAELELGELSPLLAARRGEESSVRKSSLSQVRKSSTRKPSWRSSKSPRRSRSSRILSVRT